MSEVTDLNQLKFSPIPHALSQFPDVTTTNLYSLGVADNNSFYVHASIISRRPLRPTWDGTH